MRKLIAAINMTIDGYCDHTVITPGEDIHDHYTELLNEAGIVLYGRTTYQLMEYWRPMVNNPTGDISMDKFAIAIDKVPKLVFSHTLNNVDWETATLATQSLEEEITVLKQQPGKDIFVCSPSVIVASTQLGLIDEYQLCIHPVIAGSGLPLFKNISNKITLQLSKTKPFSSGAIIHYYKPLDETTTKP